jgi:CDP-glucose 4,6-dehydratase
MRAWSEGKKVSIRSPSATRPWQHVLEPLSGYLTLGQTLTEIKTLSGNAFNFGPPSEQVHTVKELLEDLSRYWDFHNSNDAYEIVDEIPFHEAGLLKLNCDKALNILKWRTTLDYQQTIQFVGEWYHDYYKTDKDNFKNTIDQIKEYELIAKNNKFNEIHVR